MRKSLAPDRAAAPNCRPGVARVALQEVKVINEAVALEPRQSCLELRQGHLGPPLVAEHPLQHRIVAMIQPVSGVRHLQSRLVLYRLSGHRLANARPQAPLRRGRRLNGARWICLSPLAGFNKDWARFQCREAQTQGIALQGRDAASFALIPVRRKMLGKPGWRSCLGAPQALTGQGPLLGFDAAAETGKQRIIRVEDPSALALVSAGIWIHARGSRD